MEKTPIPSQNPSEEPVGDIPAASEGNPFNGLDNSNADENAVNLQVISSATDDQDGNKNVTIQSEGGDSRSDAGLLPDLNEAVNDESNDGSMVEVNLLNLTHAGSSSRANENSSDGGDVSLEAKRIWICPTCGRMFPSAQALGGHQNAHKQERQLAKILSGRSYGHPHYPYYPHAGFSANPFVRSLINNRSLLGVRPESMIQKPSFGWSPHGYRPSYGYGRWSLSRSNTQNSPTPMSLDWLRNMEGFLTNKSGSGTLAGNTPTSAAATNTNATAPPSESTERDGLLLLLEAADSIAMNKSNSSANGSNPISEGDNQVKSEEPPRIDKSTEEPPRTDKSEDSPENDDSESAEFDLMLKL